MAERLVFISYETPYAPCGGIAAVMGRMPGYVRAASGLETIVVTPYHHRIEKTRSLPLDWIGRVGVKTSSGELPVEIGRWIDKTSLAWYFLKAQDEAFFAGQRHPYDVAQTQQEIGAILQRDALFFGAALAKALPVIDSRAHWNLLMQDWEAATVVLALAPAARRPSRYGLFLTLHNSYDSGGVSDDRLEAAGIDPRYCKGPAGATQASVLERVLKLTRTPIFTVSKQFAVDLIQDPVQCKIVAPHLQRQLKLRLCGIDNGPFANLAVDEELLDQALGGEFAGLRKWKETRKVEALTALKASQPTPEKPIWGDLARFGGDLPWFVMAGRDDPRQKGYDVAALAIRRFLAGGGAARFLFFPIPGDEGQTGLTFLKKLAEEFPGSVLVLPFVFKEGFTAALQGAAFGLMPSLYEPFGMANEYYLNGTPVIGRATGGIIQQIVPLRTARGFTAAVAARANFWYSAEARPSGLLFREEDGLPSLEDDWRGINAAGYDPQGGSPDRVEERSRYALVQAMAGQLRAALEDSLQAYQDQRLYYQMLAAGVRFIQGSFSWERSAQELVEHLSIREP